MLGGEQKDNVKEADCSSVSIKLYIVHFIHVVRTQGLLFVFQDRGSKVILMVTTTHSVYLGFNARA